MAKGKKGTNLVLIQVMFLAYTPSIYLYSITQRAPKFQCTNTYSKAPSYCPMLPNATPSPLVNTESSMYISLLFSFALIESSPFSTYQRRNVILCEYNVSAPSEFWSLFCGYFVIQHLFFRTSIGPKRGLLGKEHTSFSEVLLTNISCKRKSLEYITSIVHI